MGLSLAAYHSVFSVKGFGTGLDYTRCYPEVVGTLGADFFHKCVSEMLADPGSERPAVKSHPHSFRVTSSCCLLGSPLFPLSLAATQREGKRVLSVTGVWPEPMQHRATLTWTRQREPVFVLELALFVPECAREKVTSKMGPGPSKHPLAAIQSTVKPCGGPVEIKGA
ncbi:UNVERIFIED_CONTAM: hypothetical protein K2H54_004805 [Gekko kuhli]